MKHNSSTWPSSTQLGYSPDHAFIMNTKHPSVITETRRVSVLNSVTCWIHTVISAPFPHSPHLLDCPLSAVHDFLFNVFAAARYQDAKPTILMCFRVGILSHILLGLTAEGYKNLRVTHSRAKLRTMSRSNTGRSTKLYLLLQQTGTVASVLHNV